MNSIVHVRPEVVPLEQTNATAPALAEPADLDTMLNELDSALTRFDELTAKDRNFPSQLAAIEKKHGALTNQELDSVEAIQSRSAEMPKIFCDARTSPKISAF
jgi:hypothetical protein